MNRRDFVYGAASLAAAPGIPRLVSAPQEGRSYPARRDAYLAAVRTAPLQRIVYQPPASEGGQPGFRFTVPDPGKHLWNHLFALLASDSSGEQRPAGAPEGVTVRHIIQALITFPNLFHFNADGPARCFHRYPKLVSEQNRAYFFSGHSRSLLNHPDQANHNLFTGEGTENHLAMCRYSGYLLCQNWLQDHGDDARARLGLRQTREYIITHARDVFRTGTGEWYSSTYYGYQIRGLLLAFEYAKDQEVRSACHALLDLFSAEIALKYLNGVGCGPESRGAPGETPWSREIAQIAWLWFGDRSGEAGPKAVTNAVYAALSSYRPPAILEKIARKRGMVGEEYFNSHPSYLLDQPSVSRETLYFGPGYAVGCSYLPAAGYTGASSQFLPVKIAGSETDSAAWVIYGGSNARGTTGTGRSPYDQWAHYRNVVMQFTWVPEGAEANAAAAATITKAWRESWERRFDERWGAGGVRSGGPTLSAVRTDGIESLLFLPSEIPMERRSAVEEGVFFLKLDRIYFAVRSLLQPLPTYRPAAGGLPPLLAESVRRGEAGGLGGFVIEIGSQSEQSSFAAFQRQVLAKTRLDKTLLAPEREITYDSLAGCRIVVRVGTRAPAPLIEPLFDWGITPGDRRQSSPIRPPVAKQPTYPAAGASLEGWGRIPEVLIDGKPLGGADFLDLSRPYPVISGPKVTQADGVLKIQEGASRYRIDYAGAIPHWYDHF
ncbi:MAG: hypothetical protein H7Z41_06845 [Cytophagales bacterium]|nr:hypothetical protein [Armatimonadota bacterium]